MERILPGRFSSRPGKAGQFLLYKHSVPLCRDNVKLTLQMYFLTFPAKLTNCLDYLKAGHFQSGVYAVMVKNKQVLSYCDQTGDGGGWLVIQRRYKPSDFFKIWEEYKHGFGNLDWSFWWGNEKVHQITSTAQFELRIDLKRTTGETGYAKYTGFKVTSITSIYKQGRREVLWGPGPKYLLGGPDDVIMYSSGTRVY